MAAFPFYIKLNIFKSFTRNRHIAENQSPSLFNSLIKRFKVLSNSLLYELQALQVNEEVVKNGNIDLTDEVHRFEADLIRTALLRTGGRQRRAARLLNVKVTTLNAKIKRFGIEPQSLNGSI